MLYPLDWVVGKIKELQGRVDSIVSTGGGGGPPFDPANYFLFGVGSPEGVVTGTFVAQPYLDTATNGVWYFNGVVGQNTGWV